MSLDIFKNPAYRTQAESIRAKFERPGADGHSLYGQLKDLVIRQGEWDFEQEIKDHPHGMMIPNLHGEVSEDMVTWLKDQFNQSDYLMMPQSAQGKYKDCWNWIYFRHKDQAMLFKLTWV